jgi:sensor histidine kinase YesM
LRTNIYGKLFSMRLNYFSILICLLLTHNFTYSQNVINYKNLAERLVLIKEWKINYSDSVLWKNSGYDDSNWNTLQNNQGLSPVNTGAYWIRANIDVTENNPELQAISLNLNFLGSAYEVYWDGFFINSNGKVGKDAVSEISGKVLQVIPIPFDFAGKGKHTLAIRISNHSNSGIRQNTGISIGLSGTISDTISKRNTYIIIIASVLFSFALFNFILFMGFNKDITLLFLALFCLAQSIKVALECPLILTNFNLKAYIFLFGLIHPLVIISGVFLIAFLASKFSVLYWKQLFLTYTILSAASYFFISARLYIVIMMSAAFLFSVYAICRKNEGSILSLIGLIGFGIFTYIGYLGLTNYGYFLGIIFFIFCMSISSAKQISKKIYLHSQVETRAARLESQLLKKNIQPHFILNSLSSLQELIETSPPQAAEFIDALADEFRIFSQISNEKLISIQDELKICEAHLKIMGYRKESNFTLTTKGVTGTEMIPPAIFHTLVENGLTHGYAKKNSGVFILTKEKFDDGILYKLFNDSDNLKTYNPEKKGTGLKYVESRLEESYPGKWNLISCPAQDGWLVSVKIYD